MRRIVYVLPAIMRSKCLDQESYDAGLKTFQFQYSSPLESLFVGGESFPI